VLTVARAADLTPAQGVPERNPNGTWKTGSSGNPDGIARNARRFRDRARWGANQALEQLLASLPDLGGRDLVEATKLLTEQGGYVPPKDLARLVLDARKTLDSPDEWDTFLKSAALNQDEPEAIEEAPVTDAEEDVLP
jgi:hypothetical protein